MMRPSEARGSGDRGTVLVLGQHNRQALAIVRSLHAAGYRTMLSRDERPSPTEASRCVDEIWRHPPLIGDADEFPGALNRLVSERPDLHTVFPSGDLEVAVLTELGGRLPKSLTVVMPDRSAVTACLDKIEATGIADTLGIPVAPYRVVTDLPGLFDGFREIGFPCIVKPTRLLHRVHRRKAIICRDMDGADAHFPAWPKGHDRLMVQEYVPGQVRSIQFAAKSGEIHSGIQIDTLRTDWLDGVGLSSTFATVPLSARLSDCTARLARHLHYTGVGAIQFHGVESGRYTFLELNPRQCALSELPRRLGLDFPILALNLAMGEPIDVETTEPGYPIGVRASSVHLDLTGMRRAFRGGEIDLWGATRWSGAAALSFLRAQTDTACSWRDPLPGLYGFFAPRRGSRKPAIN
ncbi:MAG: ATP-grasp domain-containing protein [Alphaproteobacteria bacterium]|nr:ATP-grasp domain-containing protein [Alphaproteobacteria bacterium]